MEICVILHLNFGIMKKNVLLALVSLLLLSGCAGEFNKVYKSSNIDYRYEYAKECFAMGKYVRAATLLQELVTIEKGTDNGEECLYMLAMSEYMSRDYETAAEYFKKYFQAYPRGQYAEMAAFYIGESLYMSTPEPRFDQTPTYAAISAYQEYLDLFPDAQKKNEAQQKMMELQDKLIQKELATSQLYYNLGTYFGNCTSGGSNYEACVITAENALKDYPFCQEREKFALLIMKSKFELAEQSVDEKKVERFRDAEDECYGFINEYPDSKERATAEKYIARCKKFTGTSEENN